MTRLARFSACVYCGSRDGARPEYARAAALIGEGLARRGIRLVYGAGDVGLMGEVARAAQQAGGQTFGVIPRHLETVEIGKQDLTSYVVTETMHERKKVMLMNADVVICLPGGAGSLDELFEALTWRQLGLHDKPVFLLNTEGYWDKLIALVDHMAQEGFCSADFVRFMQVETSPLALLDRIEQLRG
ncbi:hypothetical protein SAMN05444336_101846 [Albimonas donghaensis]|uniref:Cytokinin riboside 5'-monophosphate phosphoribohydrolase n=1 Tax=Albimonas donghaensis TaxID=356660 RepID=A0A1H2T0K6_9RHOB|nr:TIGR00730 family Rossman fold protein [Albimonas donghaensis]SDW37317.1 hypothetical protein SAMN05444336_101846 [Albimonas donghaensis]